MDDIGGDGMKREFEHIRKDFDNYDDLNAFCNVVRGYPRGACVCDTEFVFYLCGAYCGLAVVIYPENQAFIYVDYEWCKAVPE